MAALKEKKPENVEVKKDEAPAEEELATPVAVAGKGAIVEDEKEDEQPA